MTEITDKMVEAAWKTYIDSRWAPSCMRLAIEAALAAREPVYAVELVTSLKRWADVLRIPSGTFVNEDCARAAETIEELVEALKPVAKELTETGGRAHELLTRMGVKL